MENQEKTTLSFFNSNTAKMLMVGFLTLVLLIPLLFVQDLIYERSQRKAEMVDEVTNLWGKDVCFYGPILKVPYTSYDVYNITNPKTGIASVEKKYTTKYAYFFPNELKNSSKVTKNDSLKRGIFSHVVYTAAMNFSGNFENINFQKLGIPEESFDWKKAAIVVKTTNLRSIKSELKININEKKYDFEPQPDEKEEYSTLATSVFDFKNNEKLNFNFSITYNGSNSIKFIPIGKITTVSMDSNWSSPSFEGAFAANDGTKKISQNGFHVDWKVLDINRTFTQQYSGNIPNLDNYSFGVKLIKTVDEYHQNERAAKYGFLVIGLTFLLFFLIQVVSKIAIHIFQYTMIGLALVMFYTLLIAITEHSSFSFAYSIAATSVVVLIALYSYSIIKNKKFPMFIGLSLFGLYSFIYVIIQLEDYALLVGSIGLFLILAAVMYFSRKIEWNK